MGPMRPGSCGCSLSVCVNLCVFRAGAFEKWWAGGLPDETVSHLRGRLLRAADGINLNSITNIRYLSLKGQFQTLQVQISRDFVHIKRIKLQKS